jgi:hypothetical protein
LLIAEIIRRRNTKAFFFGGRCVGGKIGSKGGILLRLLALSGTISITEGEAGEKGS